MTENSFDRSGNGKLDDDARHHMPNTFFKKGKGPDFICSGRPFIRIGRGNVNKRFNGDGRKSIPSTFFRKGKGLEYIRSGSTFCRIGKDNANNRTVETACVESIGTDHRSIPHVRFRLALSSASRPRDISKGTRMLALETFTKMYPERVESSDS